MRRAAAFAALIGTLACDLGEAQIGPVADLRGSFTYVGTQGSPFLSLNGNLLITTQSADLITGSASWTEQAGGLEPVLRSGGVSGSVIGTSDVDFDITVGDETRRHVARVEADTLTGVWLASGSGASGTFRAVRQQP